MLQGSWGTPGRHYGTRWQVLRLEGWCGHSLGRQRRASTLCPVPAGYLGVNGRGKDRGDSKQAVVEGDLLQGVVSHGPHHHHITMPLVGEALGGGSPLYPADGLIVPLPCQLGWGSQAPPSMKETPRLIHKTLLSSEEAQRVRVGGAPDGLPGVPCPRPGRPLSPMPG